MSNENSKLDAERAAFESAVIKLQSEWPFNGIGLNKREDGSYVDPAEQAGWLAWQARASLPVGVPDGYALVPVEPTRTMLHRAYDDNLMPWISRQSTGHDCAAGVWESMLAAAPAAPTVKAEHWKCDPRDIAGDTGRADVDAIIGRLTSADPDFNDCADAAALLRRLVMEEISGPDGYATWRDAAVAERVKRVAMKPNENIVQIARDGLDVYAGPNMNERKVCAEIIRLAEVYSADPAPSPPAAGLAEWIEPVALSSCGHVYDAGWRDGVAEAKRLNSRAALSAQQSAPATTPKHAGKLLVSAEPLRQVLNALVSAPHMIRELQATREPVALFSDNPINVLIAEFNAAHGGE